MPTCGECKYGIGQMEDQIDGEWFSFVICAIEGPIAAETAFDDNLECDLFVQRLDDYETEKSRA